MRTPAITLGARYSAISLYQMVKGGRPLTEGRYINLNGQQCAAEVITRAAALYANAPCSPLYSSRPYLPPPLPPSSPLAPPHSCHPGETRIFMYTRVCRACDCVLFVQVVSPRKLTYAQRARSLNRYYSPAAAVRPRARMINCPIKRAYLERRPSIAVAVCCGGICLLRGCARARAWYHCALLERTDQRLPAWPLLSPACVEGEK